MRRALLTLVFVLPLLAACQLSLPGRDRAAAEANPITGGSITTTTLAAAPAAAPMAEPPALISTPETTSATPAAETAQAAPAEAAPAPSPTPAALKSPAQIACEEDGGSWARAGDGGGRACVRQTRDGGKACDNKDDCSGECLARSRTCAPIQPLFGCNAVLMDNGAEVSLCID